MTDWTPERRARLEGLCTFWPTTSKAVSTRQADITAALAEIDRLEAQVAALAEERDRLAGVYDVALDLVALWHSPKIEGLPRAERNDAISATRDRLVKAVQAAYGKVRRDLADNAKPAQGRSALNPTQSEKSDGN